MASSNQRVNKSDFVETYKGHTISNSNLIGIRIDRSTLKLIIDLEEETNLSIRKIVGHSSKPCKCCEHIPVQAINREGRVVYIPRGILSKLIPTSHSGVNMITYAESNRSGKKNKKKH